MLSSTVPSQAFVAPPIPIEHTVIIMQENHTFDHCFGTYTRELTRGEMTEEQGKEAEKSDARPPVIATMVKLSRVPKIENVLAES